MDKYRYKFGFIFIILLGVIIVGCSNEGESPKEVFEAYISHWMEEDFAPMYEMLSSDSKEYISQEDFINRYENIYNGIGGENISITFGEKVLNEGEVTEIPYTFQMDTVVGAIEFEHNAQIIKEDTEDRDKLVIQWNEAMIFPSMEQGDRVNIETISAERGIITDTNGVALVENGEIQSIGIVPKDLGENENDTKKKLADAFQMTIADVDRKLEATWVKPDLFVPIGSLSLEDESKIEKLTDLPGVVSQKQAARVYPFKEDIAHLLGYIGSVNAEELEELDDKGYSEHSVIGKAGLEQIYEETLRAKDGKIIRILDEDHNIKEVLGETEPEDGEDIQLTIDVLLQQEIYAEMGKEKGTAVAMNPKTGEVLALVNKPSYDPNQFILGISNQQWNNLNEDPDRPMANRFSQRYSPGSVFKPIVAAIGLENDSIDPDETMSISGLQWQKDHSWGNYRVTRVSDPGSPVNLTDALVYSDNIYFAQSGLKIGEDDFIEGANKFGMDDEIDFDYPIRSSQLTSEDSFSGEIQLADSGYGQGQVEVSPLHLTTMYTTFLNEGNMLKPILIEEESEEPIYWEEAVMSTSTAERIKEDLIQVVEHPQGTGKDAKIEGRVLGGKSGTAEFKESQGEEGVKNGWFIAFDSEEENIMLTIMLEDVAGSSTAIPMVKNIIENYEAEEG